MSSPHATPRGAGRGAPKTTPSSHENTAIGDSAPFLVETPVHIAGIPAAGGRFAVFARTGETAIAELSISASRDADGTVHTAAIRLIGYAAYAEDSSRPPPAALDPAAAYKGNLLP